MLKKNRLARRMEEDNCILNLLISKGKKQSWSHANATHHIFELLGKLDELVSYLGIIKCLKPTNDEKSIIEMIQNDLFLIQAEIGAPAKHKHRPERISSGHVSKLAEISGKYDLTLKRLDHFVVPGGTLISAAFHYGRAIARSAERAATKFEKRRHINAFIPAYLDRLSYLLFQLSRNVNQRKHISETSPSYCITSTKQRR